MIDKHVLAFHYVGYGTDYLWLTQRWSRAFKDQQ